MIENSHVYVDGQKLKEPYIKEKKFFSDYPLTRIPDRCVFVMGDNRNNSLDSRDPSHKVGFVPLKNVVGKVEGVFWPISKVRLIDLPDLTKELKQWSNGFTDLKQTSFLPVSF